jgi:type IV secretion system protein VirD4
VKVFDPARVTGHQPAQWTPLDQARSLVGAHSIAKGLVDATPSTGHDDDGWLAQADMLLGALLWVAANSGHTIGDVVEWVFAMDRPTEAASGTMAPILRALTQDGNDEIATVARQVHRELTGLWESNTRTSSSVCVTARRALKPWRDPRVTTLAQHNEITLDWLLGGANTLYLTAPPDDQSRLAPVFGGLIKNLIDTAFTRAMTTGRLEPTLLLVLDEAAQAPMRQLPEWSSTLAGLGIQLVTVWQSLNQMQKAHGDNAQTILTNSTSKLFFPAITDQATIDYVTKLVGHEHVPGHLSSDPLRDWERTHVAHLPLVPANVLRQMRRGEALLIHGNLPPAHVTPLSP